MYKEPRDVESSCVASCWSLDVWVPTKWGGIVGRHIYRKLCARRKPSYPGRAPAYQARCHAKHKQLTPLNQSCLTWPKVQQKVSFAIAMFHVERKKQWNFKTSSLLQLCSAAALRYRLAPNYAQFKGVLRQVAAAAVAVAAARRRRDGGATYYIPSAAVAL